jgi:tRNA pseudouridine55 synthase
MLASRIILMSLLTTDPALVLVDKPAGWTSRKAGALVSKALGIRKVGHLGTLDPFATGLLPLCVGRGTRLSFFLEQTPKVYQAELQLGQATDSADCEGEVVEQRPIHTFDEAKLAAVQARFSGLIEQIPPIFSAVRVGGQRAYKLARKGHAVEMPSRQVQIDALQIERVGDDKLILHVTCGAGTYIRSLGRDIAEALGNVGHLTALRRLQVGALLAAQASHPEALQAEAVWSTAKLLAKVGQPLRLSGGDCAHIRDGKPLEVLSSLSSLPLARYAVFNEEEPIALIEKCAEGWTILRGIAQRGA